MTNVPIKAIWALTIESAEDAVRQYFDPLDGIRAWLSSWVSQTSRVAPVTRRERLRYAAAGVVLLALIGLVWSNVQGLRQSHQTLRELTELRRTNEVLAAEAGTLRVENLELLAGGLHQSDDVGTLRRTRDALVANVERLRKERTAKESAFVEVESQQDRLISELRECDRTQAAFQAKRNALQQGNEVLRAELDTLRESNKRLFAVNEDLKEENARLTKTANSLGVAVPIVAKVIQQQKHFSQSEMAVKTEPLQVEYLYEHKGAIHAPTSPAQPSAAQLLGQIRVLAQELKDTQIEIRVLEARSADLEVSNDRIQETIYKAKRENRRLEFELEPLERSNRDLLEEADHLREQQRDLVESVGSSNEQNRNLKDLIQRARLR